MRPASLECPVVPARCQQSCCSALRDRHWVSFLSCPWTLCCSSLDGILQEEQDRLSFFYSLKSSGQSTPYGYSRILFNYLRIPYNYSVYSTVISYTVPCATHSFPYTTDAHARILRLLLPLSFPPQSCLLSGEYSECTQVDSKGR